MAVKDYCSPSDKKGWAGQKVFMDTPQKVMRMYY